MDSSPTSNPLSTSQNFEQYELTFQIKPFQLVMIDYSYYQPVNILSCCHSWKDMCSSLHVEFIIIDNSVLLFLNGDTSIEYFNEHIITYLNKLAQDSPSQPFVIISESFNEIRLFPEKYKELKSISERRFFYYEENKPVFCNILNTKEENLSYEKLSPIDFINSIYIGILNQNSILLKSSVTQLYHVLQNRHFTIEQIYQILINCVLQLKALFCKTYIKELIEFNDSEFINEICNCKTLYEIINLLNDKFIFFCKYTIKPSDVKIIEKVLNYIDVHLNEDLKLEKIADLFGYNPAYLGRLLFDRLGTNFNIYIEKKRLDKAIDMLINTDVKIPHICNMIGYQNIEYFYRKFKKYTKLTPGTYRAYHCSKLKKDE
jgi:two-component system response regulator YesN